MAFNPFVSFQKNQKFWMAAVLILCMVTFVLCTGTRDEAWTQWFISKFKKRGDTAAGGDPHPGSEIPLVAGPLQTSPGILRWPPSHRARAW